MDIDFPGARYDTELQVAFYIAEKGSAIKETNGQGGYMTCIVHRKRSIRFKENIKLARCLWGALQPTSRTRLRDLTLEHGFDVAAGDLQLLEGKWYVTHAGLLRLSLRRRCAGIRTSAVTGFSDSGANRWVFKATVYKAHSKSFVGYGDADPSNVSPLLRGAEMRIAETRAVNRALRKAYGIGLCSVEELGYLSSPPESALKKIGAPAPPIGNGSSNGRPRLRDRLCLLIRQHQLNPTLVKRYAADFCGTQELRDASRELVESFITTLADQAAKDRDGLICKLNSYGHAEMKS